MKLILALVLAAVTLACDENTLGYVDKAKYDALQKQLDDTRAELAVAKQQVSNCNRYSQYKSGWRTWRLDSMTGETCLLLASDADWKKPDIVAQACGVQQQ